MCVSFRRNQKVGLRDLSSVPLAICLRNEDGSWGSSWVFSNSEAPPFTPVPCRSGFPRNASWGFCRGAVHAEKTDGLVECAFLVRSRDVRPVPAQPQAAVAAPVAPVSSFSFVL